MYLFKKDNSRGMGVTMLFLEKGPTRTTRVPTETTIINWDLRGQPRRELFRSIPSNAKPKKYSNAMSVLHKLGIL